MCVLISQFGDRVLEHSAQFRGWGLGRRGSSCPLPSWEEGVPELRRVTLPHGKNGGGAGEGCVCTRIQRYVCAYRHMHIPQHIYIYTCIHIYTQYMLRVCVGASCAVVEKPSVRNARRGNSRQALRASPSAKSFCAGGGGGGNAMTRQL